jgi:predicted phosphodiesterase
MNYNSIKNIIFVGDIHGDFNVILKYIKIYDLRNCFFYVCGDFGVGFDSENKELKKFKYFSNALKSRNNKLVAIRGNHDDPKYFNNNFNVGNIECIPDYTILNINNIKILGIGGSISIDRSPNRYYNWDGRKVNVNYWSDEKTNLLNDNQLNSINNVDVIVSHDSPTFCYPQTKSGIINWLTCDLTLDNDVSENRNKLKIIYDNLKTHNKIKYWFYGHYHEYNNQNIDDTNFILLDCDMFWDLRFVK